MRCAGILICPICSGPLDEADGTFRCPKGHAFDRAREGYIHLLPAGHGRSGIQGDTAEMVRARRRFLERGYYEPLARAIEARVLGHLAGRGAVRADGAAPPTIIDVGCGEGYYIGRLERAVAAAGGDGCFVGVDISRDAVRLAARAHRGVRFIVNDVHHRICVADRSADVVLDVFAPRNPREFARIVREDGLVLVVVPGDDHLEELRGVVPLLRIGEAKEERTAERLGERFELAGREGLRYTIEPTGDDVADLLRMTPNRWHLDEAALALAAAADRLSITVSVALLAFRPRPGV